MNDAARNWSRLRITAFFLVVVTLFYFANRKAYNGYFSGDDLDRGGWSALISIKDFYYWLISPKFQKDLFRPVGCLYYRFLGRTVDLTYWPYVAVLQIGHLINVILLFLLLRRLKFPEFAACVGALFYAFHAMLIKAYWEPQYIFEVLALMLGLLAILLYERGHWILGLVPFWLAYKSKEIVVTLPLALLAYEMLLGGRKWKRLIPYFAISLNFGLQALWMNRNVNAGGYALRFSPQVLWHTISFYSSAIFFLPFLGLALLLLPLVVRDRRLYVGLIFMVALFVPMLVLPGRLESVYWYIPLAGLAIAVSAIALRTPRWVTALFFAIWLPLNYAVLRNERRDELTVGDQTRWYVTGLLDYSRRVPHLKAVVYQGFPPGLGSWGIEGAIHRTLGHGIDAVWQGSPRVAEAMANVPMAVVDYDPSTHIVKGMLRMRNELQSYIRFSDNLPETQFGAGWYNIDGSRRPIQRRAELTMHRPADATEFEMIVGTFFPSRITVFEEGRPLGSLKLDGKNPQPFRWKLPPGAGGDKHILILDEPETGTDEPLPLLYAIGYVAPSENR